MRLFDPVIYEKPAKEGAVARASRKRALPMRRFGRPMHSAFNFTLISCKFGIFTGV